MNQPKLTPPPPQLQCSEELFVVVAKGPKRRSPSMRIECRRAPGSSSWTLQVTEIRHDSYVTPKDHASMLRDAARLIAQLPTR